MGTRRRPSWLSECARLTCAGDVGAFNRLVDHFTPKFIACAKRLLAAETGAAGGPQDLVQDTWITAWPKLQSLKPQETADWEHRVRGLLIKILRDLVGKAKRSANRQVKAYEGFARAQDKDTAAGVTIASPLDSLVTRSETDRLWVILASLRPADREIIRLRFHDGLRMEELAEQLGLTDEAAWKRLSRALGRARAFHSGRDDI